MAPVRQPPPPEFEYDASSDKVRCSTCREGDPSGLGLWIDRRSAKKHLESEAHQAEARRKEERVQLRLADEAKLQRLQHAAIHTAAPAPASLQDLLSHASRPSMFNRGTSTPGEDPNAPKLPEDFSPTFHEPSIPAFMEPAPVSSADEQRRLLEEQLDLMFQHAQHEDEFGLTDADDLDFVRELEELRIAPEERVIDPEEILNHFNMSACDSEYFPYPSKVTMLLDILDNLPRLRMSGNSLRLIIWILNYLGVTGVPSYDALRALQEVLRKQCGSEPLMETSVMGNVFYVNDLRESIARDFANPEIAKHLHFYPEEATGPVSEVWQASRWKEFKPSELTPMFARGLRHFYLDELCQCRNGSYVIPRDWVIRNKVLTARCSVVSVLSDGWVIEEHMKVIAASEFEYNYHDIIARIGSSCIPWKDGTEVPQMPSKLRELADGKELYVIMVPLWCDDVSGNRSKQYNKHINMYTVNSNLPGQLLQQEYFVHFVSASPHATAPEQFSSLRNQVNSTHSNPIECYNANTHSECCVMVRVPGLPADNPQQSEEASHMGGNANFGCRKCDVGGNHERTESNDGYHKLHLVGNLRDAAQTRQRLEQQTKVACYGIEKAVTDLQSSTGTKDKIAQYWIDILLKKSREMRKSQPSRSADSIAVELQEWLAMQPGDKMNPLLAVSGLDPTQDTPIEILHTILLGIVKYVWHMLNTDWSDDDRAVLAMRLQSTDISGLSVPPIQAGYMIQYRNNLIGKHFKTLMQVLAFSIHGLVSPKQFTLVKAVGALGAVLWVSEIDNMDEYLNDLSVLVANVLDAFGDLEPNKIIVKLKLHILTHLPDDVRRFGPAVRNSTEVFECFNAVFRLCSIYSNHQAPSRDIAHKFASMDRLKHILSGGYWKEDSKWVQAGEGVRKVLKYEPIIQRHLGWVSENVTEPGSIYLPEKQTRKTERWDHTLAFQVLGANIFGDPASLWSHGKYVTSTAGDNCTLQSWVYFVHENNSHIGRIAEVLLPATASTITNGYVVLDVFAFAQDLHPDFGLPMLCRASGSPQQLAVLSSEIQFALSVQHDCGSAKCPLTRTQTIVQEREKTSQVLHLVNHTQDEVYVVNLYALHNARLLRKTLPRSLTEPKPLYTDREAHHTLVAAELRVSQADKRAKTQDKRRATLAAKKRKTPDEDVENPIDDMTHIITGEGEEEQVVISKRHKKRKSG